MRIANLTDQTGMTLTDKQSAAIFKASDIYVRTVKRTMDEVSFEQPEHTRVQAIMVAAVCATIQRSVSLAAPVVSSEFTQENWETAIKALINGASAAGAGCAQGLQIVMLSDELRDEARRIFVESFDMTNATLALAAADAQGHG